MVGSLRLPELHVCVVRGRVHAALLVDRQAL